MCRGIARTVVSHVVRVWSPLRSGRARPESVKHPVALLEKTPNPAFRPGEDPPRLPGEVNDVEGKIGGGWVLGGEAAQEARYCCLVAEEVVTLKVQVTWFVSTTSQVDSESQYAAVSCITASPYCYICSSVLISCGRKTVATG